MTLRRRTVLQAGAAAGTAALAGFAANAFAQAKTKLRVGYLHTPAVDGQIWLGQQSGTWNKHGLELELIQFTTGLELFQAAIVGGWAARNDYFDANKPVLGQLVAAWAEINDAMLANFDAAADTLQKTQYKD